MEYVIKRVKFLEDSCFLISDVTETIENVMKQPRSVFLGVSCLLENMLAGKTAESTWRD